MVHKGMEYLATYSAEKKCDDPESNKTDAGAELTRNIPTHNVLSLLGGLCDHMIHTPADIVVLVLDVLRFLVVISGLLLLRSLPLSTVVELA